MRRKSWFYWPLVILTNRCVVSHVHQYALTRTTCVQRWMGGADKVLRQLLTIVIINLKKFYY